jgi:hypothetical protein
MFSRRAREHIMAACNALDNHEDEDGGNSDEKKDGGQTRNSLMTAHLIEKIVKLHRAMIKTLTAEKRC